MSRSNFCANCGVSLSRKSWRAWLAGARCDDCASRLGARPTKPLILIAVIAIAAFAFGKYLRPGPPPLIIHRTANSPLSDLPVNLDAHLNGIARGANSNNNQASLSTDGPVYICGARTRKGTPCRRRVHAAGERCYQHQGMPAMVSLEKLTIKPDGAKR
jgi:hypothetical protein